MHFSLWILAGNDFRKNLLCFTDLVYSEIKWQENKLESRWFDIYYSSGIC